MARAGVPVPFVLGALGAVALVVAAASAASAGRVVLMNDEEIRGEVVEVTTLDVSVRSRHGVVRIPLDQVQDILDDRGRSIYRDTVGTARERMAEELAREAEERRLRKLGKLAPEVVSTDPAGLPDDAAPEAPPQVPQLTFRGAYQSVMHGFRLNHPLTWRAGQEALDYYTFEDPRSDYRGWKFNVTVFDPIEMDLSELRRQAKAELELHRGLRVIKRWWFVIDGQKAERTTAMFERDGLAVRHEQVIVETKSGRILLLHFFVPGGGPDPVPEIEAVLRTMRLSVER